MIFIIVIIITIIIAFDWMQYYKSIYLRFHKWQYVET